MIEQTIFPFENANPNLSDLALFILVLFVFALLIYSSLSKDKVVKKCPISPASY